MKYAMILVFGLILYGCSEDDFRVKTLHNEIGDTVYIVEHEGYEDLNDYVYDNEHWFRVGNKDGYKTKSGRNGNAYESKH